MEQHRLRDIARRLTTIAMMTAGACPTSPAGVRSAITTCLSASRMFNARFVSPTQRSSADIAQSMRYLVRPVENYLEEIRGDPSQSPSRIWPTEPTDRHAVLVEVDEPVMRQIFALLAWPADGVVLGIARESQDFSDCRTDGNLNSWRFRDVSRCIDAPGVTVP